MAPTTTVYLQISQRFHPLFSPEFHHASPWKPPCQERYESLKARRGAGEAVDPGVLPVISYSLLRRKWSFIDLLILIYHDVPLRNGDIHWFSIARLVYQRVSSSAHGYMMGILNSIYIYYMYIYNVYQWITNDVWIASGVLKHGWEVPEPNGWAWNAVGNSEP